MGDSNRLAEAIERCRDSFATAAARYDPSGGYVPASALLREEIEAIARYLIQAGDLLHAGALQREANTLRSCFPHWTLSPDGREQDRRLLFHNALKNIPRLLEEVKRDVGAVPPSGKGEKQPKVPVAARMLDLIKDKATHTWTARQFASKLGCSPSSVVSTAAWKELSVAREMARLKAVEQAQKRGENMRMDRRRRSRSSPSRRSRSLND